MVFSSHLFVFYFLPVALGLYYLMPRRTRHLVLTLVSYVFYGWANPLFVVLMFVSTLIDYTAGLVIAGVWNRPRQHPIETLAEGGDRTRTQKIALIASVTSNLTMLGFFKYFNFGIDNYNALVHTLGFDAAQWDTFLRITLPLGISFYTFQSMSYAIDVYRGHARAVRSFTDFACYVSMYPQLVAGPIVRFHEVAEQFETRTHTIEKFARGVAFFSLGLAKKVLIANACGKVADVCFNAGARGPLDAWYGLFAYSFQIYFDFSGYSDMAIGLGLMLGFVFPKNFDSPYRSQSITELWRRWHLSLSTWLRENLYIVLGGNRKGRIRTYANLAMVMLLGGLWHGASWNFVLWGAIHGGMLAFERMLGKDALYRRAPAFLKVAVTFLITSLAWVFFRAPDMQVATDYFANMVGRGPAQDGMDLVGGIIYQPYYVLMMGVAALVVWAAPQTWDWTRVLTGRRAAVCALVLILSLAMMSIQGFNPFIYFIF